MLTAVSNLGAKCLWMGENPDEEPPIAISIDSLPRTVYEVRLKMGIDSNVQTERGDAMLCLYERLVFNSRISHLYKKINKHCCSRRNASCSTSCSRCLRSACRTSHRTAPTRPCCQPLCRCLTSPRRFNNFFQINRYDF